MGTESMISTMISNLLEKLKGFGEESMILMNSTQAKLKAVGADEMANNLQEKIRQLYFLLADFGLVFVGWLEKVFPPGLRTESMISNLHEMLKGIGEESMVMMNSTLAKLRAMGAEEMMNSVPEKLKQLSLLLENMASFFVGWFGEVVLPGLRNGSMIGNLQQKLKWIGEESMIMMNSTLAELKAMGAGEMMNHLQEKLKQLFLLLENFGLFSLSWLEEVFPLQHWLRVNAPFLVIGLVLLVLVVCFSRYTTPLKTMKAPGRNYRISRAAFETNPKGYFRALRASKL